ncbi:MAG: molybdenum cofactor biosynthesis enzyme, partial [Eggerthellaceae bacterium]|nr:molybdenum cofactor biosynthesis enzyme [Eggerthellaceae bacterium]
MKQRTNRAFFADDGGFGTVGMVLALLISVSLVVGSAQVYRIRSVAADIQNVADACALAAEKQVASFYLVAQVCDCAVFSLALAGTATVGLGIVVAFIPPAEAISAKLVDAGKAILDARTRFARACTSGLNRLQTLLPLFAAIDAAAVASANSNSESAYHAIAVLCPFEGDEVSEPPQDESLPDDVDERRRRISEAASDAEESQRKADAHKLAAFMADCGNSPSYCMYERAETLAGMGGQRNPHYSSVDAWSFGVALSRARDYYWERYLKEVPLSEDVDELARSAIRERFYAYAVNTLAEGYVTETQDAFSAYFPLLPRNTDEMRSTWLYTEGAYPVTEDAEGFRTTHAFEGCPGASEELFVGMGSVELMEAEGMERCPVCRFAASSVGKVAAASTSIDNGFEYHYHVVAREAELYEQERGRLDEKRRAAQEPAQGLFDTLSRLLGAASESRIKVAPPGRIGAIAVVFDSGGFSASDVVATTLVSSGSTLGMRAAISAA